MATDTRLTTIVKADKGLKGGSCNRRACQKSGATWWNPNSRAYYCEDCASLLNQVFARDGLPLCAVPPQDDSQ